jgi:hypothetical protein
MMRWGASRPYHLDLPVVVAVVPVRMVKPITHQVIGVIAVRDGFVTAVRTVPVTAVVSVAEARRALGGVLLIHLQPVFVEVVLVRVV